MLSRRPDRPGDRGATLVEAAIALPVVLLVLLGTIEVGMLFSTTSSTRDGARYATSHYAVRSDKVLVGDEIRQVVERDLAALTGQGTPVRLWIYRADGTTGAPTGGAACATDCLRYTWDAASGQFAYDTSSVPWTAVDACVTVASPRLDDIGVLVEVRHEMVTGVIGTAPKTIRERSVLRLEPLPTTQCPT